MSETVEHDFRALVARLRRERQSPAPRGWWARTLRPYAVRERGRLISEVLPGRYMTRWGAKRAARALAEDMPLLAAEHYTWKVVSIK